MRVFTCALGCLLCCCFLHTYGQSKNYSLKGVLLDSAQHSPLVSATVYVKTPGDSTVIALGFTDAKGRFLLKGIPRDKEVQLMIFYTGYKRYRHALKNVQKDLVDLRTIYLAMSANTLNAVTITGDKPPITIKGDTIEFNASSFKTRPNSVLADLLKKLPGVDVDRDGSITANGKKVDKILVNGKKFFGNDPQIALQNLPAAIVDKVQVTDTKTREEELTGKMASGNTKTINITLKKGKDHGFFGRAYAGYGTGKHYDASGLINYFEGKQQISLLGATNNINQVGFSVSEIANMIGSNNIRSISINSSTGSFGINGISFGGGGEGLKKSTTAGINYNNDYGKHFSVNGSYFYGGLVTDNNTRQARQNILPDSVFYYNATNAAHNEETTHRVNATLSYKDSLWRIYYEPSVKINDARGINGSDAESTGEKGQKVNESDSRYTNNGQSRYFSNRLNVYRVLTKKGSYLRLYLNAGNNTSEGKDYNHYRNIFYDGSAVNDSVNQYIDNHATDNRYEGSIAYSYPFTKAISLALQYGLQWQHGLTDKKTYDYNDATGKYTEIDSTYSNKFRTNTLTQIPQIGFRVSLDSGRWRMEATADFNIIGIHHYSFTYDSSFNQNQFFVSPGINFSRRTRNKAYITFRYSSSIRQPSIQQLLPVTDNRNSLYQIKGNPHLKPSVDQNIGFSYNKFDFKSGNNIWLGISYHAVKNDIASVTTYQRNLSQLTTYTNINGNNGISANLDLSKTKKKPNYHWQVKLGSYGRTDKRHAFVNGVPYLSHAYSVNVRPSLTYGYKDLFEITPSYRLMYQYSKYDLKSLQNREAVMQEAALSGTLYWPKHVSWESDWNYTYNSNVTPGFRKGYWLWNASVGVDVFKKRQATLQLSVHDLLNQDVSVRRSITDTYVEDTQTIILHRYFMLKFIYNLRKLGKKKKKEDMPFFFF